MIKIWKKYKHKLEKWKKWLEVLNKIVGKINIKFLQFYIL